MRILLFCFISFRRCFFLSLHLLFRVIILPCLVDLHVHSSVPQTEHITKRNTPDLVNLSIPIRGTCMHYRSGSLSLSPPKYKLSSLNLTCTSISLFFLVLPLLSLMCVYFPVKINSSSYFRFYFPFKLCTYKKKKKNIHETIHPFTDFFSTSNLNCSLALFFHKLYPLFCVWLKIFIFFPFIKIKNESKKSKKQITNFITNNNNKKKKVGQKKKDLL